MMKQDFPVEQTVKARHSVRTYEERPLSAGDKEKISQYIAALSNPFSVDVSFRLLEKDPAAGGEKLGTYGMIKGARDFIGAAVAEGELALEALGYSFEKLILYGTSLGLGTCWLGGTFNRSGFAAAMGVKAGELFPTISPVGYPLSKKRIMDSLVRWSVKADQRKDWDALFFQQSFSQPLTRADAGTFALPLEMLRLAPSAGNKQPWRVVKEPNAYHFYEMKSMGDNKLGLDIQRVDIGIAACHFHLSVLEKDLRGRFERLPEPAVQPPENTHYIFSWVVE